MTSIGKSKQNLFLCVLWDGAIEIWEFVAYTQDSQVSAAAYNNMETDILIPFAFSYLLV